MTTAMRVRLYLLEARCEFLKTWRLPGYTIPALAFPIAFYVVFGILLSPGGPTRKMSGLATYLIATYGACGAMSAALQSFGVNVAIERGLGWFQIKRVAPMPLAAYVVAKLAVVLVFSLIVVGAIAAIGATAGGVHLPFTTWLRLSATLALGVVPLAAIGLLLGVTCGPNAIGAAVNIAFMGGAVASGLWMPIEALPAWWQRAAVVLPPYHYGRLALAAVGIGSPLPLGVHVAALAGCGLACIAAAVIIVQLGEERSV